MKTKILLLAANPHDTSPLQLDEEVRAIDQALRQAEFRDQYELVSHWAVRIEDLQELLLRHRPHIVHFSGHATADSGIILQTAQGGSEPVAPEALGNLFGLLEDNVRCVVLNACYSAEQAGAIVQQIDVVIGMSNVITDGAAIAFAAAFYRALAFGRNVKTAFELGRNQIELAGLREGDIPQLLTQRSDPERITIPGNLFQTGSHYRWALLTILPLLVLVYYLFQILFRWVAIDLAFFSFVVNLVQLLGVFLAILGLTTDRGRNTASALWDAIVNRFPPLRHSRNVFAAVTCLALVAAIGYTVGSPALAARYNGRGLAALDRREYSAAAQAFQQALLLAPDNGRIHFNAGLAHEAAGEYDQAMDDYKESFKHEPSFWPAYNNLGRLHLLPNYQPNPVEALRNLQTGLDEIIRLEQQPGYAQATTLLARGVLRKNMGWAHLQLNSPDAALADLQSAIASLEQLEEQSADKGVSWLYLAESYSLLAQSYEALANPVEAQRAWGNSEGYALIIRETALCKEVGNAYCIDAQIWADEAAKQIEKLSEGTE